MAQKNPEAEDDTANRRERLREWIADHYNGKQAAFVRAKNLNQGEISGLLRTKSFGSVRARSLEAEANMPARYLDSRPGDRTPSNGGEHRPLAVNNDTSSRLVNDLQFVPYLSLEDVGLMKLLNADARLAAHRRYPATPDTGPRAKAIHAFDDSMSDVGVSRGDMLTLDPDLTPEAGDIVLVEDNTGAHHFREYRERKGGAFEAAARNPTYPTYQSKEDGLRVLAIVTHIIKPVRQRRSLGAQLLSLGAFAIASLVIAASDILMPFPEDDEHGHILTPAAGRLSGCS